MSRDWTTEELQAASKAMKAAGHMSYDEFCIEGLREIRRAIDAWDRYRRLRYEFMEGDVYGMPKRPAVNIGDLQQKYPRAAAYLKAESWYKSRSFKKSELGKKAMDRILAGEDHAMVLDEMMKAWTTGEG